MPKITVTPHSEYAPHGATVEVLAKATVCDALLEHGIEIDHAKENA